MRRQTGPVQQWIDSIPSPIKTSFSMKNEPGDKSMQKPNISLVPTEPKDIPYSIDTKHLTMIVSAPINVPNTTAINTTGLASSLPHRLVRDPSLQSDSSHCSSVESLLELRKADPEAILLGLGFGGCPSSPQENGTFSRIPKRFLQPSKLKGIAINDFMKKQQETSESFDSVSLGYRGLTGSPYVEPSEIVQKIMQRLREHESNEHDPYAVYNSYEQYSPLQCNGTLSVLSPDSRQFLERPRSKSPDMRNKRMIIGQKSFAFGNDGDLIEIQPTNVKELYEGNQASNVCRIIDDSNVCNNVVDHCGNVSKEIAIQKMVDILPERLSFEDSIELRNAGFSSSIEVPKENSDPQSINADKNFDYKQGIYTDATSQSASNIRRASDALCDTQFRKVSSIAHERRHSDGLIQVTEYDNGPALARKRKTLKRQSRISDVDATECCSSKACMSDAMQCKESHSNSHKQIHNFFKRKSLSTKSIRSIGDKLKLKNKTKSDDIPPTFSTEMRNCVQLVDDCLNSGEQQLDDSKCCVDKAQSVQQVYEDEGRRSCCCHSGTKKYWKKMEKLIQGNKDLETMVTKNRRDMAEIREMLNSVLSVRLEPGF